MWRWEGGGDLDGGGAACDNHRGVEDVLGLPKDLLLVPRAEPAVIHPGLQHGRGVLGERSEERELLRRVRLHRGFEFVLGFDRVARCRGCGEACGQQEQDNRQHTRLPAPRVPHPDLRSQPGQAASSPPPGKKITGKTRLVRILPVIHICLARGTGGAGVGTTWSAPLERATQLDRTSFSSPHGGEVSVGLM